MYPKSYYSNYYGLIYVINPLGTDINALSRISKVVPARASPSASAAPYYFRYCATCGFDIRLSLWGSLFGPLGVLRVIQTCWSGEFPCLTLKTPERISLSLISKVVPARASPSASAAPYYFRYCSTCGFDIRHSLSMVINDHTCTERVIVAVVIACFVGLTLWVP